MVQNSTPSAKVSDEAVEAAAKVLFGGSVGKVSRQIARNALTAALPHLTACVGGDVRRLVIAARVVAFEDQGRTAIQELDDASEAFADRIPWDDEPYDGLGRCGECGHVHSPRKACPAAPTPDANRG